VRERIPDRVLDAADEVELIDMAPNALRQRMRHGNIYPPDRAERALEQFFREGNLIALHEMALRKLAQVSGVELEEYMQQQGIDAAWSAGERVMVCIDDQSQAQNLVRRAWRMAYASPETWAQNRCALRAQTWRGHSCGLRTSGTLAASSSATRATAGCTRSCAAPSVQKLLRQAGDVDVHVVADRERAHH
jgi:K+-sensing histidine kinase KdpD